MVDRLPLALSVLDQVPISDGFTHADAVQQTVALAELTERLGYRRYWLAEHHNSASLASSTPEILVTRVASATRSIRVGAGGVMLMHYSPLKVAENFRMLEAMFPGRIDLGIGRAPGGDELTAVALAQGLPRSLADFPAQLRDLAGFLSDSLPDNHPFKNVHAYPAGQQAPPIWLLGSTDVSAQYAAYFGFSFAMAQFINPSAPGPGIMAAYRRAFRPSATHTAPHGTVAVWAMCADSEAEAQRLAASAKLMHIRLLRGEAGPVPGLDAALRYAYTPAERQTLEGAMRGAVVGAPEQVKAGLERIAAEYGVDEVVIVTICHAPRARQRSYELIAEAFGLAQPSQAFAKSTASCMVYATS